jgi:succinoglycan biosynthesis transport protein ExoP
MKEVEKRPVLAPRAGGHLVDRRILQRDQSLYWAVVDTPFSRFAESVRTIKVAADLSKTTKANKVVGITSSLPNEGKSTISMALAQSIANGGSRVILLDGDLRNPGLSRKVAPHAKIGILEVLTGRVPIEDAVCVDPATRLAFLPAVVTERIAHSSDVLACEAMRLLVDRLRESYDYVLIDLSPLAPVVDVRAMTHLVDSFLFVIEWGRTKIDVVEHVLGAARGVYDNLLGIVLNKADLSTLGRYDSPRGEYYHNRYYARYGYTD